MSIKIPLNWTKKTDMDFDPTRIIQPGYNVKQVGPIVTMLLQATASATASFGYVNSATYLDNIAKYVDNSTPVYPAPADEDPVLGMLEQMVAQAWTAIRYIVYGGDYPTMDVTIDDNLFKGCFEFFKAGILNRPFPWVKKGDMDILDSGLTTDLSDAIEGVSWGDDAALSPAYDHIAWFARIAYAFGVSMRGDFPQLSQRIEATNNATIVTRNLEALFFLFPITLMDYFYLSAAQSDVAVFNIAALLDSLVNKKVPSEIFNAIDQSWRDFVIEHKYAVLGTNLSDLRTYTGDFIGHSLLDATTLDNVIHDWKTKGMVSNWALKKARTNWGIGVYEKHGEKVHFMNLFNGAIPDTGYTTHGDTTWELGINIALLVDYMKNREELVRDYLAYVNKKSYTWTDVAKIYSTWFTEFSVLTSLKGFCEPEAYRPLRRQFAYSDHPTNTNGWRDETGGLLTRDPQLLLTGDAFKDDENTRSLASEWAYFYFYNQLPSHYRLYFPYDIDEAEFYNMMWFGLLFDMTADDGDAYSTLDMDIDTDLCMYTVRSMRLIEMINSKMPDKVECLAWAYDTQIPKFEDVNDVLDLANYEDTALKYGSELIDSAPASNTAYCSHRPKGWKDAPVVYLDMIAHEDVAKQMITNAIGMSAVSLSSSKPSGQTSHAEVDDKTEGDAADSTEV